MALPLARSAMALAAGAGSLRSGAAAVATTSPAAAAAMAGSGRLWGAVWGPAPAAPAGTVIAVRTLVDGKKHSRKHRSTRFRYMNREYLRRNPERHHLVSKLMPHAPPPMESVETEEDAKYPNPAFRLETGQVARPSPSGWEPPRGGTADLPYAVKRSATNNIPVYLKTRGTAAYTQVRHVWGNAELLAQELKVEFCRLDEERVQVRNFSTIELRGDHVDDVTSYLRDLGF